MPPFVISIFIAHQGCPHRCIFCNQLSITGNSQAAGPTITGDQVQTEIRRQLAWPRKDRAAEVQVAFYGGSFTGLPRSRQRELLGAVASFLDDGLVQGIRLSTRPDYIDLKAIALLQEYRVGIVELGVQSLTPAVLAICERGHTVQHVEEAIARLKSSGFKVGAQLMVGLPGETRMSTLAGARRLIGLSPDFVRIYPALVLKSSRLAEMQAAGEFRPLSLSEAVLLTARLKEMFEEAGIRVVRMGLQPSAALEKDLVAGPYHPAFGDLVRTRMLFKKVRAALVMARPKEIGNVLPGLKLAIAGADQSVFRGQRSSSINRLVALGLLKQVEIVFDSGQARNTVLVTSDN